MFNRTIHIGNLVKDVELRYTHQGTAVTTLRIACTTVSGSGESRKEETLFIDIEVWGKMAESCGQYLSKGRPVLVEGRLKEQKWESDGQTRSKFIIVAQTVKFLGNRSEGGAQGQREEREEPPYDETSDIEPF